MSTAVTSPTHPMPTRAPSLRSIASTDTSPSAAGCPRHRRDSPYTRNTDGEYASHTPACTGGDCILGRCDRARTTLHQSNTREMMVLVRDRLQHALEAAPADTAIPQEALRVRALLDATISLHDAYQTWLDSGEDTPHTRDPLERALRAAEATHDTYTPSTALYDQICTRLGRTRARPVDSRTDSMDSSVYSDATTSDDSEGEMIG